MVFVFSVLYEHSTSRNTQNLQCVAISAQQKRFIRAWQVSPCNSSCFENLCSTRTPLHNTTLNDKICVLTWLFRCKIDINNYILPLQPPKRTQNMFDNLWTYIGYFTLHFPNDWSTNCRPMVATRYVQTRLCIGGVGYHSLASWWRSMAR